MRKEMIGAICGNVLSIVGTAIQTQEILQIVSLIISIIGGLITASMPIVAWFLKAKKDGKIDKEELKELDELVNKDKKEK